METTTAIFATKFGCAYKIPAFLQTVQHHVEKPNSNTYFNILPQLPLDETLILSEPVRQIQDFTKTIDLKVEGLQPDMAVFGKDVQTRMDRNVRAKKLSLWFSGALHGMILQL